MAMGGSEKLQRRRNEGKLNARERASLLFDEGTFNEIGVFTGTLSEKGAAPAPADGLIAGFGKINGRPALAGIEDFTVLGGSIGDASADKRYRLTQLAAQERIPLIFMLEGSGHRLTNKHAGRAPNDLQGLVELSGRVPLVCLVLGPSAGHSALAGPLSDFTVMTDSASMFAAGPPIVKGAIGEVVTKEELGGPQVHVVTSGVAHNLVRDDAEAIALAREYLAYFPLNAWERPPLQQGEDIGERKLEDILSLINPDARVPFDVKKLLLMLVDQGSLLEIQPAYGDAIVTALARMGGQTVAIVANNSSVRAGAVDAPAANKATHFMDVASAFHLPVIFLTDNPGVMPGKAAERTGALRHAARMFVAQHRLTVPKIHVTLRKAFGFGSSIMAMNPFDGQTLSIALPAISLGAMPASSGSDAAKLDPETRARLLAEQTGGAFQVADKMGFDDVIDPRDLRNAILRGLTLAEGRQNGTAEPVMRPGISP